MSFQIQEYTTGTGNWTVPAGVYLVDALIVGGGGGGGAVAANGNVGGGGGGGGEVVKIKNLNVIPGESIPYVVGALANGGAAGDNDGTDGNLSSFAGIVAAGGKKVLKASTNTGGKGGSTTLGCAGGAADTAGDAGTEGTTLIIQRIGGGGGGGGYNYSGTAGAGGAGLFPGGAGGAIRGGGGGGSFRSGGAGGADANGVAGAANSGGGGGGGAEGVSGSQFAGGAGGSGYIRLTWYSDSALVDDVFGEEIENSKTFIQVIRGIFAYACGKATGGGTTTIAFRDNADTKDRISSTVDAQGNRSAVSLDLT